MTRRQAIDTLVTAFGGLTPTQRKRLLYHAERGTKILCGEKASFWEFENGG